MTGRRFLRSLLFCVPLLVLVLGGAAYRYRQDVEDILKSILVARGTITTNWQKDQRLLGYLYQDVQKEAKVQLLEGVPRGGWDEEEPKAKSAVWRHFSLFYDPPLELSDQEKELIRELGLRTAGYASWREEKLCGGFHPDWAIIWESPQGRVEMLVCFGCDEVKIYSHRGYVRLDMGKTKIAPLKDFLEAHRS